jgi:ribosome-associated heat shock protein Hsp15
MPDATLRLDKWLWYARFCKTRSQAQALIEQGHVTINGVEVRKAAFPIGAGLEFSIDLGPWRRTIRVLALGERRGPATEARGLFVDLSPPARLPPGEARPLPGVRRGFG